MEQIRVTVRDRKGQHAPLVARVVVTSTRDAWAKADDVAYRYQVRHRMAPRRVGMRVEWFDLTLDKWVYLHTQLE